MTLILKNLTLVYCCIYSYMKLLNILPSNKQKYLTKFFCCFLTIFITIIEKKSPILSIIILFTFLSIYFFATFENKFLLSIYYILLSYSISYICLAISSLPISIFLLLVNKEYQYTATQLIVAILQIIIIKIFFHFKRLRKGLTYLLKNYQYIPCIITCLIIFITSMLTNCGTIILSKSDIYIAFLIILIYLCAILLIFYWNNVLTKTYIDELTKRTIENLNEQLADKDKAYETLLADKERLSEIVHADKKLVSALEVAVVNRLESTEENPEKDKELLDEIRRFSRERKGSIEITEKYLNPLPSCGIIAIDNVLSYMYQKASPIGIHIVVAIDCDVKKTSETLININDFSTLLADMLDNALIATKLNQGKHVLVSFSIVKKHFVVQISDSGIPFTKEVLYKMGKEQITTHANEEGNGIGLMKTFEILNKVNASLFIEEYDQTNGLYTKTLSVAFNGKKQYILYTTRDEMEIAYLYQRPDITVIHK